MVAANVLSFEPVPCLSLFSEKVLLSAARSTSGVEEEVSLPVARLSFDYGGTHIGASEERERFFVAQGHGVVSVERDREREARASCLLERFGAVELGCLDGYEAAFGSKATHVIGVEADTHAYCSFTSHALPELEKHGFRVSIAEDYPYQVLPSEPEWYMDVAPLSERADWFGCELGVEVDGTRVNLLDALLGLLDEVPDDQSLERLSRRSLKFWALPVGDQKYVRVPRDLLWGLFEVLRELYSGREREPHRLELSQYQGSSLETLASVLSTRASGFRRYGADPAAGGPRTVVSSATPVVPHGLQATLRPYQAEGLAWLQRLRESGVGGVLADDMGLGKTLQTIAHLCVEYGKQPATKPTLIVLPTSLIQNWSRELQRFAPHLSVVIWHGPGRSERKAQLREAQIVLTTYMLLVREIDFFSEREYHYLILDEAQAIKNPRAAAREAVCQVPADHRLCLSGTPVENHLGDLWSMFDFLMPGLLDDPASFQARYRVPIEQEGNEQKLAALRRIVEPFILRRTKSEVATDLPPKTVLLRPVRLEGSQRELYESIRVAAHADVRQVVRNKGIAGSTVAILDALMKLRQVCCDPRLVRVRPARAILQSAKLEYFFGLLAELLPKGHRLLVFSQFTSMLSLISDGLGQRNIGHLMLTGGTQDRQAKVDAFERGDADVFLISLKAGGTGLNLTSADTVIHYDPWWNPAAQAQATDRAYRIGQTKPVFVYQLIVAGSVEERMVELQRQKQDLAAGLVGSSASRPPTLSEGELSDLFSPLEE